MKITKLELLPVECQLKEPLRWGSMEISTKGGVLVRVHTDEGITGVGEAGFSNGFYPMIAPIIRNILEHFFRFKYIPVFFYMFNSRRMSLEYLLSVFFNNITFN